MVIVVVPVVDVGRDAGGREEAVRAGVGVGGGVALALGLFVDVPVTNGSGLGGTVRRGAW